MAFKDRLMHAWNAFTGRDPTKSFFDFGPSSANRPDRPMFTRGNERSISAAAYNKIAIDVASVKIRHVRLDENDRFVEEIESRLNECLEFSANIDQTGRALIQDAVQTMFDNGVVAIVPFETSLDPVHHGSFEIYKMRVGRITEWFPENVRVNIYNEKTGQKQDLIVPKSMTVIVENPFYSVVNEYNSTLNRLITKLNLLDAIDKQSGAGKLDMIIQLPYTIRSDARKLQARERKTELENQLANSQYGIAYIDGTEKVTQLNRSLDNQLMKQIEYLTSMFYNQLGITQAVFDGTADEQAMLNYSNRCLEPILSAITEEMRRKWLTKTARSQGQSIIFFREPFKLTSVANIAEVADTFTRNEILTPNEIRSLVGFKPVNNAGADELRNRNLNKSENMVSGPPVSTDENANAGYQYQY